jgi:polyphosphate kinase
LGRFLEHDRIFYFFNNGQPAVYIGSADWRSRNLRQRVELVAPIEDPELRQRCIQILEDAGRDNRLAWELDAEGHYRLRRAAEDAEEINFHELLMKQARKRARRDKQL